MAQMKEGEFDRFIVHCETVAKDKGFDISILLSSIEHHQLFKMAQQYSQSIIDLGATTAEKQLEQNLVALLEDTTNISKGYSQQHFQFSNVILVKKDREKQKDQLIIYEWKQARKSFYEHEISNKLKEAGATQEEQKSIIELFLKQNNFSNKNTSFDFGQFPQLQKYALQIKQLRQTYRSMQWNFTLRSRECRVIENIIQSKQSNLKIIKIQYQQKIGQFNEFVSPYSVSAFRFFQVVDANKLLTQVTVIGVEIRQFQYFLRILNPSNKGKIVEKEIQKLKWMGSFRPSKSLRLAINNKLLFKIHQQDFYSQTNDLIYFCRFFSSVSHINAVIICEYWRLLQSSVSIIVNLWKCLKTIKFMNMSIQGYKQSWIDAQSMSVVRSILFGELTSFTGITKLSFKNITIHNSVKVNYFLILEESLATIFTNNSVTHLQIYNCSNFPVLPEIITLHSIDISFVSFRKQEKTMSRLDKTNKFLESVVYENNQKHWKIDKPFFNKLHTLIIGSSVIANTGKFKAKSYSNIKDLRIQQTFNFNCFLHKLRYLTSLSLVKVSCGHQVICGIPSLFLEKLKILLNNSITNEGLKMIDKQWPLLRYLQMRQCYQITARAWKKCQFRGLIELKIDLLNKTQCLIQLKRRGTKITNS